MADAQPDTKKPWQSKTIWTNVILALLALLSPTAQAWASDHPEVLPLFFTAVNVALRFITKDAVSLND